VEMGGGQPAALAAAGGWPPGDLSKEGPGPGGTEDGRGHRRGSAHAPGGGGILTHTPIVAPVFRTTLPHFQKTHHFFPTS